MITPVLPMLATAAAPFDSEAHVFEVKWDGVRALAGVSADRWRLWGRGRADYTDRYPELAVLRRLPAGTVVDGELVVFVRGQADLAALLRRHPLSDPEQIRRAGCHLPVRYLLFDVLTYRHRPLLGEPLLRRRAVLADLVAEAREPLLVFSEGLVGPGRDFFARVVAAGQEGVMAKQLTSRYRPGQRSAAWRKIKPVQELACVIVGYTAGPAGLDRLLVATLRQGVLAYAGQLGCGLTGPVLADLADRLARRRCSGAVVPCPEPGLWVQPELYCRVRCFGWTPAGQLRYPVFRGLLPGASAPGPPQPLAPPSVPTG